MNLSNKDFIVKLLILIEFIVLAFGCLFVYILSPNHIVIVLVVVNICSLIFMYTLLHLHQTSKLKGYLKNLIEALNSLTRDGDENVKFTNTNPDLDVFYEEIENIRETNKKKEENRYNILNIVNAVAVNMELEKLLADLMPKLIDVTKSNCGAYYMANNSTNKLEIKESLGFSKNIYGEFDITLGEGFIGGAALNKEIKIIKDIPDGTVYVIRTFLGKIKPRNVMIVPIVNQDQLLGIFVFASIYDYQSEQLEMVNLIKYYVGAAVGNGITYEKTKRLTSELKFQNRLIQNLNEDLESKVQDRTQFLNDIIDSIKDYAIYALDKNGIVMVWNKGSEMLFGYSAKEIIGKHIEVVYPSEEIKAGAITKRIDMALTEGKYMENGWRYRKDGTRYYAEMVLFARYDNRGEVIGFTNVTKDITDFKKVETAFLCEKEFSSELLGSSTRALILADNEGNIILSNSKAEEILQMTQLVGTKVYHYFENSVSLQKKVEYLVLASTRADWIYKLRNSDKKIHVNVSALLSGDNNEQANLLFYLY